MDDNRCFSWYQSFGLGPFHQPVTEELAGEPLVTIQMDTSIVKVLTCFCCLDNNALNCYS